MLLEIPYSGKHDRVWVQWTDEGLLLYAATKQVLKVWRLLPSESGAVFAGQWTRPGRMLGQPTMGERYPVLALRSGTLLEYVTLTPGLFKPSGAVGAL